MILYEGQSGEGFVVTDKPTVVLRALMLGLVLAGFMGTASAEAVSRGDAATSRIESLRACENSSLDLYRQDGTAFGSAAECRRYAAGGLELVHLAVTMTGSFGSVKGHFVLSEDSGFGLLPGSTVAKCGVRPSSDPACVTMPQTVGADGTYAATSGMHWVEGNWLADPGTFFCWNPYITPVYVTGIYLVATTERGSSVRSRTTATGCTGPL